MQQKNRPGATNIGTVRIPPPTGWQEYAVFTYILSSGPGFFNAPGIFALKIWKGWRNGKQI